MAWTRSDVISAGSLVVAALALAYGPVKDYQAARNAPSVTMSVVKICARVDPPRAGPTRPAVQEKLRGTTAATPRATATPTVADGPVRPDHELPTSPQPVAEPTTTISSAACGVTGGSSGSPDSLDSPSVAEPAAPTSPVITLDSLEIRGRAENVPLDRDLWVVLRPEDDGKFYPVARARKLDDGRWQLAENRVRLPRTDTTWAVFVYAADSLASRQLHSWDDREDRRPPAQYEGMPSLPPDLALMDSATVVPPGSDAHGGLGASAEPGG